MRFKPLLLILSMLLQSCTMSFSQWGRSPASVESLEDIASKMKDFKGRLLGSTKDSTCTQEQLDEDFKKMMASLKRDSCSVDNYTLDEEAFKEKACPKVKTAGYFDKVVKTILKDEAQKKVSYFQNRADHEFNGYIKEAQNFLKMVQVTLSDDQYPHTNRAELLSQYVENVLLPVREIIIVMRSYVPQEYDGKKYYLDLQPQLSESFLKGLSESELGLITQGPNAKSSPFYLELKKLENNISILSFSETDSIKRDILTLLKAPTAKNYVIALKWMTLHMMLSQVYQYDTILGNREDLEIPKACQSYSNGSLPPRFKFTYEEGEGEAFLGSILASHGLTTMEDDNSYFEYYLDNDNKDPTKEGYSGVVPFENYKNGLQSLQDEKIRGLMPDLDDVAHFQAILSSKLGEASRVFRGKVKNQSVFLTGHETFQEMLGSFPAQAIEEIKTSDGETAQIYPSRQNLSPYLLGVMKSNGFLDYSELVTERMKKKFVGKKSLINFPSMYSAPAWRDWSLRIMADAVHNLKDVPQNSNEYRLFQSSCLLGSAGKTELGKICRGNVVQNLAALLDEFRTEENFVPTRRLEEKKFREIYPYLSSVWILLRDNLDILPQAKPFELNFLMDQMSSGNPWARLKFSYMVALDQLEYQREGLHPQYVRRGQHVPGNSEAICKTRNVELAYNNLTMAGKVLGLDKTLTYNHGGSILSSKEKKQIWKNILDNNLQQSFQLFSAKTPTQNYYQLLEDISYRTILTKEAALSTNAKLSSNAVSEINEISQNDKTKLGEFFLKLYQLKDSKKQLELMESFSKVNGIDTSFKSKLAFLTIDTDYKKPIYKDLLKQAAQTRKLQILSELDRFCKMSINDENQFKDIFYSTTKAQNDINQMAGLPTVPEEVLNQINKMTASEWRDMWWGIGSGVVGVAAIVVGGACTTLTGGICAPLGGAMAVAGTAALGIQVKLTTNELERKKQADISESQVKVMEDLGFANIGSAEGVHRSYAWAAFEAISIFPLIGVAARSLTLGPKLVYVSTQSMLRQTGESSFKAAAKSAVHEEEVRSAHYLLGFSSVSKNAGIDAKTLDVAKNRIAKIRALYTSGEIDYDVMISKIADVLAPIKRAKLALKKTVRAEVGRVVIKESKDEIDLRAANMISNYFADNPKEMLRQLSGYSGERLNKAIRVMSEVNTTDRVGRVPIFSGIKDWYLRMRNESLAKNAEKILRIEKELTALGTKPGVLEKFIHKNIEDITDIYIDIPMKKRELPYFVFAQGVPEFNFIKGRRIPVLSAMSQGQTLRRIVLARARLVSESYKTQARKALKLKKYVHTETTYDTFRAFQLAIGDLANRKVGKEAAKVIGEYRKFEDTMAKKLYASYQTSGQQMEYKAFKELITNPSNLKDKALAETIWESVPADELMGMKEVGEFAHKAVQELSKYSDVDSFERYLSAMKVLIINRNPAVLEIM